MQRLICALMMCVGGITIAGPATAEPPPALETAIAGLPQHALTGRAIANEVALARAVYASSGSLLWSTQGGLSEQARALMKMVHEAGTFGLIPDDYGDGQLVKSLDSAAESSDPAQFDVWLTLCAARFISHLHYGRIDPHRAGFELNEPRDDLDIVSAVIAMSSTRDVAAFAMQTEPHFFHYGLLKLALERYRQLALDSSLTQLPAIGHTLHRGDPYAGSTALRKLLMAEGDLPISTDSAIGTQLPIDATVSEALERYQMRHGLAVDGYLSMETWRALTTPLSTRVRQIELTLERWRWLPPFSTPPIIVNIPQFQLFAFDTTADRAASILQMPVIVGQTYPGKRTPVFVGDLKYIIFRPYWDIPRDIALREMLPAMRRDPDYLKRNHLELVRGENEDGAIVPPSVESMTELAAGGLRVRQQPGADNALGLVKFVFPNAHDVYMHSTPARNLFLAARRAFSHGCIRVSDPEGLADFVLKNAAGSWDRARIEAAMQDTSSLRVDLIKPIRVMILYGTAMATEAGAVQFFDDIYGHDRQLSALLGL
jgi:murein L,D-transpeptidase YcbB/YkuD